MSLEGHTKTCTSSYIEKEDTQLEKTTLHLIHVQLSNKYSPTCYGTRPLRNSYGRFATMPRVLSTKTFNCTGTRHRQKMCRVGPLHVHVAARALFDENMRCFFLHWLEKRIASHAKAKNKRPNMLTRISVGSLVIPDTITSQRPRSP